MNISTFEKKVKKKKVTNRLKLKKKCQFYIYKFSTKGNLPWKKNFLFVLNKLANNFF